MRHEGHQTHSAEVSLYHSFNIIREGLRIDFVTELGLHYITIHSISYIETSLFI